MKRGIKYLKIFANLFVGILGIILVFYIAPKIILFFMPFVVGYIISLIANPIVRFLEKRLKIVRKYSSIITIIGVLACVILIFYFAGSKLVAEAIDLASNLPQMYEGIAADFEEIRENFSEVINRLPKGIRDSLGNVANSFGTYMGEWVKEVSGPTSTAVGNFAKNVPGALISIIMGIIAAYFFTAERDKIGKFINEHIPASVGERVSFVIKDLKHVVGGYFEAQFKIMLIVYLIVLIGLVILQVEYAWIIGLLISFLDMLPFFGTGTILGPWAIIKILSGDYKMAIALIVLYAVTQLVRQLIQPKLVGDSIGMEPLVALIFMFVGFKFGGVIGMIIAVPVGMIIINLYKAGVFDNQINCLKELIKDFNDFRKL